MRTWTVFGCWVYGQGPCVIAAVPGNLTTYLTEADYGDDVKPFAVSLLAPSEREAAILAREKLLGH